MALALALGGENLAPPPLAAAQKGKITNLRWHFNVILPDVLCVGAEKDVRVTPLVDITGTDEAGRDFLYDDHIMTGISMTAKVQDTSIATVSPLTAQISGTLPSNILSTHSLKDQAKLNRLGEMTLKLKGVKAGTTNLYLTAKAPVEGGAGAGYFGPGGYPAAPFITVVNCSYKVSLSHQGSWNGPGGTHGTDSGFMTTIIKGEGGELSGTGSLIFSASLLIPHCKTSFSISPIPTTIQGHASETELGLSMAYAPSDIGGGTATCPFIGSVSGFGSKPVSDFLAVNEASFPADGGTRSYSFGCLSGTGSCTLIITAEPLDENQPTASTQSLSMAPGN